MKPINEKLHLEFLAFLASPWLGGLFLGLRLASQCCTCLAIHHAKALNSIWSIRYYVSNSLDEVSAPYQKVPHVVPGLEDLDQFLGAYPGT